MKNREIIEFIDRYCAHKENLDTTSNADLAYAILAHGYLYVRPGKSTEKFTLRVIKALKIGANDGFDSYLKDGYNIWPLEEWIRISMAGVALKVAKKFFDKRYFEKQVALLDSDEDCDDTLIDKYLNLMSKEQLNEFMCDVSYHRANDLVFTSFDREVEIMDGLHERCRKVNSTLPEPQSGYEYWAFKTNNPYYLFDYLNKEEIISAIKSEIIWNKSLAGHMARTLYNTDSVMEMDPYIQLIGAYEHVYGKDIYKPDIFYETLNLR